MQDLLIYECEYLTFEYSRANDLFRKAFLSVPDISDDDFVSMSQEYARFCVRSGDRFKAAEIILLDAQERLWSPDTALLLSGIYLATNREHRARSIVSEVLVKSPYNAIAQIVSQALQFDPTKDSASEQSLIRDSLPKSQSELIDVIREITCTFRFVDLYTSVIRPCLAEYESSLTTIDARCLGAVADWTSVVKLLTPPANAEAANLLAEALLKTGNQDAALQCLLSADKQVVESSPSESLTALYRQGELLLKRRRYAQAREAFIQALSHAPLSMGYVGIACTYLHQKDYDNCLSAAKVACRLDPERAEGWGLACFALLQLGVSRLADVAFHLYTEKLASLPSSTVSSWLLVDIGFLWIEKLSDGNKAEVCAAYAAKIYGTSARVSWLLGEAMLASNMLAKGVMQLVAVADSFNKPVEKQQVLAKALQCCKEDVDLLEIVNRALNN